MDGGSFFCSLSVGAASAAISMIGLSIIRVEIAAEAAPTGKPGFFARHIATDKILQYFESN